MDKYQVIHELHHLNRDIGQVPGNPFKHDEGRHMATILLRDEDEKQLKKLEDFVGEWNYKWQTKKQNQLKVRQKELEDRLQLLLAVNI